MLIIRHGESTWNAVRRWQGQADPPLTERGEGQARRAGDAAQAHGPFDFVATSTLQRARRTGELIAQGLGIEMLDGEDGLSERSAGEWEGLTRSEIEERFPGYLENDQRPPGYEPDESIIERSSAALRDLAATHAGSRLLVVSHGGIIHALERAHADTGKWERLDNLTGRWFNVGDTAIEPTGKRIALVSDGGPPAPPDRSYA